MGEQGMKSLSIYRQDIDAASTLYCSIARAITDQGHLAKTFSGPKMAHNRGPFARLLSNHFYLSVDDDVESVPSVALTEDNLSGFKMSPADSGSTLRFKLDDVWGKDQIQKPVGGHPDLPFQSRKPRRCHASIAGKV